MRSHIRSLSEATLSFVLLSACSSAVSNESEAPNDGDGGAPASGGGVGEGPGIDINGDGGTGGAGVDVANPPAGTGGTGAGGTFDSGTGGVGSASGGAGIGATGGSGTVNPPSGTWSVPVVEGAASAAALEYTSWHDKYFEDCGDGTACIKDGGRCVSEGIGYGMLAAVSADDQTTFDKLWAFYVKHKNQNGVMKWQIATCGDAWDENGATDAELDAAYALIQADSRWGGGSYAGEASTLIHAIKEHETETCDGRIILKPGDTWGGCSDMNGQNRVNPSYFAPGYYRAFAAHVPEQADYFNKMVTDTYDLYDIYQERLGGLIPDWAAVDGADWYGAGYGYESVRAPWRVAIDLGLSGDERAREVLRKLADYTSAQGGPAGVPYDNNSAFRGSFATSGLVDQATADSFYASWMGAAGMDDSPYYQGTLRILFVQAMGGAFYVP